jgi:endonuclease/exonuclease/phosphatase family metal-dependent hydrolase
MTKTKQTEPLHEVEMRNFLNVRFPRRAFLVCTVLLAGILFASVATSAAAEPADLRVMSFNIRFAREGHSEAAPENNWSDSKHPRRERTIRVIREMMPDLLGLQEARDSQINDLKEALAEYEFYGVGRDDGKTGGEYSGIFFLKDRFTKKDAGSFWLSETPDQPGTTFSYNKLPRIASWVKLADNKSGCEFVYLNMHWDHQDATAREKTGILVHERLKAIAPQLPAIVTGDLNSFEDTKAFRNLVGNGEGSRKLLDSYRELHPERIKNEASFDDWKGTTKGSRIDFILHTDELKPVAADIVRTSYDGLWPSDHYPVTATLQLNEK